MYRENAFMKKVRFWLFIGLMLPCGAFGATVSNFKSAAQLLSAAQRGDATAVRFLVNAGADINYVDNTGLSPVCTAIMNNDKQAVQILQSNGADASNCDKQIKNYKQKNKVANSGEEYDFFSGLSSSHVVVLSGLGVAAVIGGVALLSNAFDTDASNSNSSSSSGGSHGSGSGGGNSSSTANKLFTVDLPYGPACDGTTCPNDFSVWEGDNKDFAYMSNYGFNYLMASRAYNAFVRGYLGMQTIRLTNDKSPFDLKELPFVDEPVGGGKPVNITMVTGSGVNPTGSAMDGTITWIDSNKISAVQSICQKNGTESTLCKNALTDALETSYKYFNYSGEGTEKVENTTFDLSGSETVFGLANNADTKLAKIIAGWEGDERANADFYGFVPNAQLLVYKTGDGKVWTTPTTPATGTYSISAGGLDVGDTFGLFGTTLTVKSVSSDLSSFVATDGDDNEYRGYIANSKLYINSTPDGDINQMYSIDTGNVLNLTKEISTTPVDYKNYYAIKNALDLKSSGNYVTNVVVNLALPAASTGLDYATVKSAKLLYDYRMTNDNSATALSAYKDLIDNYYNLNKDDDKTNTKPSTDADAAFKFLSNYQKQILINPAGNNIYGKVSNNIIPGIIPGASFDSQVATFENFAPVAYSGLENLFMTVVAVTPVKGTKNTTIENYSASNSGTLALSQWLKAGDTETIYTSRICGLTGNGNYGAMNPWCFAAPGITDVDAAASMAGGVALVKSAFDYMTPKEIFLLLALTADGPYLGTNPDTGSAWKTNDALITYLKSMYTMPGDFDVSDDNYLESFKQVFGYGMINLERATRPKTNLYFYSSNKNTIVSSSGTAYWRSTTTTSSRASSVLSLTGRKAITTSFYDVIESADGTMSLPRVWKNTLAVDDNDARGLYMGDVLGDFNVDSSNKHTNTIGKLTVNMALSNRAYNDNMNGLDDMRIAWNNDTFDVATEYQHRLTDGESRFNGRANGVLNLVSNSLSGDAMYRYGSFGFGGRAFVGAITDENLLDKDPVVSAQFEPARLGLVNGGALDAKYGNDSFNFDMSFGVMHENNTVLGMVSDGMLALNGADTKYVDAVVKYKPFENVKLSLRGTYAITDAVSNGLLIADISNIKSNSFALGVDVGGFGFTAALPLAVVDGRMGYNYADLSVVENGGKYEVAVDNAHIEYVDLSAVKREMRFTTTYKYALGNFTDAGVGFIYRVNPNNTDVFGNESILMFKLHHRLGI